MYAIRSYYVPRKRFDDRVVEHDRQDAVAHAVPLEDAAEARRDDAADAPLVQRPDRVLARGPAAEVRARENDPRAAVRLAVQDRNNFV